MKPSHMTSDAGAWRTALKTHRVLIGLFLVGAALRLVLLCYVSPNAIIVPDEMLYANLARAIHLGQPFNVHGQPVSFHALLYPLLISPVYALPTAANRLLVLQVFNTLLMASAVIPAYALARRMGCGQRAAWVAAGVALLLPDFVLAGRIMTEALAYPLLLWGLLACARLLERPGAPRAVAAALVCAALYGVKEGGIALTAALVAVCVWRAAAQRDRKPALWGLAVGCGVAALCALAWVVLRHFIQSDLPTIYDTQYAGLSWTHVAQALGGLLLYALFVPVGFGVLTIILPLTQGDRFGGERRWLLRLLLLAMAALLAGVCYLIFCDELYNSLYHSRIHLRYVFAFLPVLLAALLSKDLDGARLRGRTLAALGAVGGLLLTFGLGAYTSGTAYPVDAPLLSFLDLRNPVVDLRVPTTVFLLSGGVAAAYYLARRGWDRRIKGAFVALLAAQLALSNVAAYQNNQYQMDAALAVDGRQAAGWLEGRQVLLVSELADGWFDYRLNAVDLALARPQPVACLEDLCPQAAQPTLDVPAYWAAGAGNEGVQADIYLINNSALNLMVLAEGCATRVTDGGYFVEVTPPAEGVWLHSALAGLTSGTTVGAETAFYLFDPGLLAQTQVRLYLTVTAAEVTSLTLSCGQTTAAYDLPAQQTELYLDLPLSGDGQPVRVALQTAGQVTVNTYALQ